MLSPSCRQLETCRQELVPGEPGTKVWNRDQVHSFVDMKRVIRAIVAAMTDAGLTEDDIYWAQLGVQEALVNANKHGHQGDWSRPIQIRYSVSPAGVVAEIEDQGPGFELSQVPDPLALENLDRLSGRGLLMMRTFLSGVCHNEQGNCICLCKHRCQTEPQQEQPAEASAAPRTALPLEVV